MNKLYCLFGIAALLSACTKTPQEQAQKNVSAFLKENLLNPGDYKSIAFDTIRNISEKDTLLWVLEIDKIRLSYSDDSAAVLAAIKQCEEKLEKPGIDTHIVIRLIDHTYKHKGLDGQPVELKVTFQLDNDLQVIDYGPGIQGQGFFDVFVVVIPTEFKRVEKYTIDGQSYSIGTGKIKLAYGKHSLTWWCADKSLVDNSYLPAFSHDEEFFLQNNKTDSVPGIKIIMLNGYSMHTYNTIEEFKQTEEGAKMELN
jgi:hypothetical protein